MSTRPIHLFANWKMNLSRASAVALAREIAGACAQLDASVRVALFASHPHLEAVGACIAESRCELGAQDLAAQEPGAFTGAVSAEQLEELGARWVLIGHSERRHVFGDDESVVAAKLRACLRRRLLPLLCVGEDLAQREQGRTEEVVLGQLRSALDGIDGGQLRRFGVAYEPVWAIGTGHHADPDEAERMHALLREQLRRTLGPELARDIPILYGGSVNAENAAAYFRQNSVDGALVGGASLRSDSFLAILERAQASI